MARMTVQEALRRLRDGNRRFVSGTPRTSFPRRPEHLHGQDPFAIVLGCSDSRVPVEIVLDQGPGDLFVVRVAGHAVLPALLGSVEIAVEHLDPALVLVLGHTDCAAVGVALDAPAEELGRAAAIADVIRGFIEGHPEDEAVRANVEGSVAALRDDLPKSLTVVGGIYSVETGVVDWLD